MLATFAPLYIWYSQEARMYAMLSFLLLMSAYFFVKALKTGATKNYIFWGIFLGLACLTHYMGVVFAATFYLAYLAWKIFDEKTENRKVTLNSLKELLPSKNILTALRLISTS